MSPAALASEKMKEPVSPLSSNWAIEALRQLNHAAGDEKWRRRRLPIRSCVDGYSSKRGKNSVWLGHSWFTRWKLSRNISYFNMLFTKSNQSCYIPQFSTAICTTQLFGFSEMQWHQSKKGAESPVLVEIILHVRRKSSYQSSWLLDYPPAN